MPSSCAFSFIARTNADSLPLTSMATAMDASLPEAIIMPYRRSSNSIVSPAEMPILLEPDGISIPAGIVISRPTRSDSSARMHVMILVVLAG